MGDPSLKEIIERHRERLLAIDGVNGVGAGTTAGDSPRPCIIVFADVAQWPADLPRKLDGYPVELHRTSGFRAR